MVELKKKVTLKTKVAETATQNQQTTQQSNPSSNGKGKKLGVFIVLAVIAVVAFFLLKPDNSGNDVSVSSPATSETVAQNADNAQKQEAEQPGTKLISEQNGGGTNDPAVSGTNDPAVSGTNDPAVSGTNDPAVSGTNDPAVSGINDPTVSGINDPVVSGTSDPAVSGTNDSGAVKPGNATLSDAYIEEKAKLVIRGDFGNGAERKRRLGAEYKAIQKKVNEMYAKGLVY